MTFTFLIAAGLGAVWSVVGFIVFAHQAMRTNEKHTFPHTYQRKGYDVDHTMPRAVALGVLWPYFVFVAIRDGVSQINEERRKRRLERAREEQKRLDAEMRRLEVDQ